MSFYQSICQYRVIVWVTTTENILKQLIVQKNKAICVCLNKTNKIKSSKENYKELGELPVSHLHKKFAISLLKKKTYIGE